MLKKYCYSDSTISSKGVSGSEKDGQASKHDRQARLAPKGDNKMAYEKDKSAEFKRHKFGR